MSGNAIDKLLEKKASKRGRQAPPPAHPKPPMDLNGGTGGGDVPPVNIPDGPGEYGSLPIKKVVPNPRNPRKIFRNLDGLANSIRTDGQLQPVTVVTRAAYLNLFPDDEAAIKNAEWVTCMGSRRVNAIVKAPDLTVVNAVVDDRLAETALRFHKAAVEENQNRADLSPMEEGRAFLEIADIIGRGGQTKVAEMFVLSKAHVSQRIALLKLIDELQAILDRPDYKDLIQITVAVKLAQLDPAAQRAIAAPILALPAEEQYAAWKQWSASSKTATESADATVPEVVHAVNNGPEDHAGEPEPVSAAKEPPLAASADETPAASEAAAAPTAVHAPPRREHTEPSAPAEAVASGPAPAVPSQAAPLAATTKDERAARAAVMVLKGYDAETIAEALIAECDPEDLSKLTEILYDRVL